MSDLQPVKTFWQRREGTAAKATIAVVVLGLAGAVAYSWAAIVMFLANVLYFYACVGGLAVLAFLLMHDEFRKRCLFFFMGVMQYLFAIDPLVTIKGYISVLYKRLGNMVERIKDVSRQRGNLQQVMDQNAREAQNEIALARKCGPGSAEFVLHSANAGRLKKSNDEIKVVWTQLDTAYRVLTAMKERAEIQIKDFQNTVAVQERQLKALKSATSAYRSAMSIIQGDPSEKYIVDQAMENLADRIGESIGEIDHFMDISETILKNAQLQNAVDADQGLKMLEEWSKSPSLLLGSQKNLLVSAGSSTASETIQVEPARSNSKSWDALIDHH